MCAAPTLIFIIISFHMSTTSRRPFLLISNDDGYKAPGINFLIDTLRPIADILVVAPSGARSGFGCAITATQPIQCRLVHEEEGLDIYSCTGSPVDCVKLAFNILLKRYDRLPDLVVSGVNHGDNSSVNTFYSGTMGAASEGVLQGVPGIGFSYDHFSYDVDMSACAPYIVRIVQEVLREGLPPLSTLNVNFPDTPDLKGVKVCRMARSRWINEMAENFRPRTGAPYYWLTGEPLELEPEAEDTDRWALAHGYVAITPQTLDATNYPLLQSLQGKAW